MLACALSLSLSLSHLFHSLCLSVSLSLSPTLSVSVCLSVCLSVARSLDLFSYLHFSLLIESQRLFFNQRPLSELFHIINEKHHLEKKRYADVRDTEFMNIVALLTVRRSSIAIACNYANNNKKKITDKVFHKISGRPT